ncbi:hypothetical protein N7463_007245 [Penicillium fimorum]|uniref:Uncharacterized protein n=1 Tax=Penicillium fimorum TaxID=1882269 RepID=A0A9W9XWS3_9EURO|nr:hypothetical protein N7463_007245 [Penicillium fimorum]
MESTTEPTTEPTMDPNDSPLSNLDLWCDWSGSPKDPVSITIAMEAHDHPNLHLPILNVQSANIVKRPSWVIRLKPELAHYDDAPPEKEASLVQEYGDAARYPANNPSISDSGSVVVYDGSRDNDPVSRRTMDISAQVGSPDSSTTSDNRKSQSRGNSLGSLNSPNPRKRSAKAASLPDSIPPDDDYQGTRHKLMTTKINLPGLEPGSQDTGTATKIISSRPCPIHMPSASLDETSVTNENIPPHASAPTLVPDPLVTSKHLSPNSKGATVDVEDVPHEVSFCHSGEIPNEIDLADTEPLTEANLRVRNYDTLSTRTPPIVYNTTYQIAISFKVRLHKGKSRDWWELVVSGLPRLAQFESCYLYFRTPPGQGMEFMTSCFKRHTLVESCLMAQFDGGKSLVVPFRKCNAQFYGPLKDHKVNTAIQAEVEEADPSSYMIKYNAVCSIDLVNHDFWAEKCQFDLVVHGGPEGEFKANFEAQKPLINAIRLQPALAPDVDGIGLSRINIISTPQALDMFTVSWEVKLPRGMAYTWLPWIKTRYSDVETILLENYAISGPKHEYLSPTHQGIDTRCRDPWFQLGVGLNHSKPPVQKTPHLYDGFNIHEPGVFDSFSEDPASYLQRKALLDHKLPGPLFKSASTQTFVGEIPASRSTKTETPVAEPEQKKPGRAVHGLWTLIKLFFHLFAFLASVHTIYWSYFLQSCGLHFDSSDFRTSCPQKEVYIYMDYAENCTNTDLEKEANTILEEFDLQPELIRSEVQQSINATPAQIIPVPLRDRIDYLLGWRGPIARE